MRLLIELPTWLGDCVMATPAIEALVGVYPDSQIVCVGSKVSVEAISLHPNVVNTLALDKSYLGLRKVARELGRFDLFFSFRSSIRSSFFKFFVSAKNKYQFDKNLYQAGHQVEKYTKFVADSLSVELQAGALKLYAGGDADSRQIHPTMGINPGASYGSAKRWYPQEFAKVAAQLSDRYDIVIFGGPNEQDIANDIEQELIKNQIVNYQNLAGRTTISELIEQISGLDLFITGDSGPMHVAAAFQVPTVAIFGPTKDDETSQWMNKKSLIVKQDLECQPCMKRVCPLKHHNCMKSILAEDVLKEVNLLI